MTTTKSFTATGRGWAYVGAVLGGSVSIAANVAHSYVPPTGAPAGDGRHGLGDDRHGGAVPAHDGPDPGRHREARGRPHLAVGR
jgi:hypothetical protein